MVFGIVAGSVAAVVAILVSLPLRSPSDTLFNSASLAVAALTAGVLAGAIWQALGRRPSGAPVFLLVWTLIFVPVSVAAVWYGRSQLDHFTAFAAPLAVIVYGVTGVLTALLGRLLPNLRWWWGVIAVAAALLLGIGLVNQGDQESGELKLPPPNASAAPGGSTEQVGRGLSQT